MKIALTVPVTGRAEFRSDFPATQVFLDFFSESGVIWRGTRWPVSDQFPVSAKQVLCKIPLGQDIRRVLLPERFEKRVSFAAADVNPGRHRKRDIKTAAAEFRDFLIAPRFLTAELIAGQPNEDQAGCTVFTP